MSDNLELPTGGLLPTGYQGAPAPGDAPYNNVEPGTTAGDDISRVTHPHMFGEPYHTPAPSGDDQLGRAYAEHSKRGGFPALLVGIAIGAALVVGIAILSYLYL